MRRIWVWVVVLGLLCAASPLAWGAAAPRLRFQAGQTLSYEMSLTASQRGATNAQLGDVAMRGTVDLKTVRVKPDGTAVVQITTAGEGVVTGAADAFEMGSGPSSAVTLVVKPDGSITSATDASGKPHSLLSDEQMLFNSASGVREMVISTTKLFGLQLPKALPRVGGSWKGTHIVEVLAEPITREDVNMPSQQELEAAQKDQAAMARLAANLLDLSKVKQKLKRQKVPVTFTNHGTKKYQGRACLLITSRERDPSTKTVSSREVYLDAARGQVAGWEVHQEIPGGKVDVVMRLLGTNAAPAATPKRAPATGATGAPAEGGASEEAPPADQSGSDDDYIPVVR